MRRDMPKIIVERPRWRPPFGFTRGRPARDIEDAPARQSMRGHLKANEQKYLNENLAPLRRYLAKQVGRPWNKVYSEICEHVRIENPIQYHVRIHLRDYVSLNGPDRNRPLYVDRRTGLLRRMKKER